MKKTKLFLFTFLLFFSLRNLSAEMTREKNESIFTTIYQKNVMLYEQPSIQSPIVRRVFIGEVLKVIESIKTEQGEVWGKVYLSPTQVGYIQSMYYNSTNAIEQTYWVPKEVLRNQMPFSLYLKGPSETFGAALMLRYLPFTRIGLTAGVGSVIDDGQIKGSTMSYGAVFMLSTNDISPFVETGSSTLTYNDTRSTLRISTFYVNAGVEWIFKSGYYFGAGVSYIRSYEVQIEFNYSYAKNSSSSLTIGNYGSFGKLDGPSSLQQLNPMVVIGYSF